jgi:hypothetical protein
MALVAISPVEAYVRWDRMADRPAEVSWSGRQRRVVELDAIRDERSAYPADRGPRVTFVVRMEDGVRASLTFRGTDRRWYLEALEPAA